MRYVVYGFIEDGGQVADSWCLREFPTRDEACGFASEQATDGIGNVERGCGYEVQPWDDGPYYVCDIYDIGASSVSEWHADRLEKVFG